MTIRKINHSDRYDDLTFIAGSDNDTVEQLCIDYLSDNSALLSLQLGKKQAQVTIAPHIMRALRDSLNNRYPKD
jgi:hypothetical protein